MIATLLLAQVLLITPSAPPAPPAEAARTLLAASPDLHVRPGLVFDVPVRLIVMPAPRPAAKPTQLRPYPPTTPWVHVAPAPNDPTIRTVRIIDERTR